MFSITWGTISGWWLPVCILLGSLYAWVLYRKPSNLGNVYRYALFAARAISISLIAIVLISPMVKSVKYSPQKPLVLVLQDNSQSITLFGNKDKNNQKTDEASPQKVLDGLGKLKNQLGNDYDVREFHFDSDLQSNLSTTFNGKQTDISKALHSLNQRFENQNIGAIVLATDGLYNIGNDPQYEANSIKASIYTLAQGDTSIKRDLLIGNVNYNKTAFLDNYFMIEVLVEAYQSKGESMTITAMEDGKKVASQNIQVTTNNFKRVIPLKLLANQKGLKKYEIGINPIKNELSTQNNYETIYVDVLDARQKVLLLYDSPHPDIAVIRQNIAQNKNFEVKPCLLTDINSIKPADYSLVILYQVGGKSDKTIGEIIKSNIPVWFILGGQSNAEYLREDQKLVALNVNKQELQEALATPVPEFTSFSLSDSSRKKIAAFPPLLAPFGQYRTMVPGTILFKQRIGSTETIYPLFSFGEVNGKRIGVLTAEGIWRWHFAEFNQYNNHHALEELFGQAVQYLTANANRQRFNVFTTKSVFDEGEEVILNAELYNEALELFNKPDVKLELKNNEGKNFSFLFTRINNSYQLNAGILPAGEYAYEANTEIGAKQFKAKGKFTIKALNLESRQSTANIGLLNSLAKRSGGKMLMPNEIGNLADLIRKNENIKTVVYEDKHYNEFIDLNWVFALIIGLLAIEWFFRKREGEI